MSIYIQILIAIAWYLSGVFPMLIFSWYYKYDENVTLVDVIVIFICSGIAGPIAAALLSFILLDKIVIWRRK